MQKRLLSNFLLEFPRRLNVSLLSTLLLLVILVGPLEASSEVEEKIEKRIHKLLKKYNLKKWSKKIAKAKSNLHATRNTFNRTPSLGIKKVPYKKLKKHQKEVDKMQRYLEPLESLRSDLSASSLVNFAYDGPGATTAEIRAKSDLEKKYRENELSRTREVDRVLKQLQMLTKNVRNLTGDWMYFYSRKSVILTLKETFEKHHFADNAKIYREFIRRTKLTSGGIEQNPKASKTSLVNLKKKIEIPLKDILALERSLQVEGLYDGISARAHKENIDYQGRGLKKIEGVLNSLSLKNLKVVGFRKSQWNSLKDAIDGEVKNADRHLAYLKRKADKKAAMKRKIAALGQGKYEKDEDDEEEDRLSSAALLDATFSQSVKNKSGQLKTSKVESASKKLHVEVNEFNEGIHETEEFDFNVKTKSNFDRLSAGGKISTSLYTYTSSTGRASKKDLRQFVNEVGLISYGSSDEFITYSLPKNWKPGRKIKWVKEKSQEEEKNHDRHFTYVELFTEAHKVRKGKTPEPVTVARKYISPNMFIVFDSEGGIKRYQTFTNIKNLKLRKGDISGEKVFYKFLNYNVKGREIHLNGIDFDIKTASL